MITSACGLDCYDGCKIIYEDEKIRGDSTHPVGNGALCSIVNKEMKDAKRLTTPMINGKEVSMSEALSKVAEALKSPKSLLYRGSGNVGMMQEVTNLFMKEIDGCLTKGSLCDGSGDAGIVEGRGVNRTLPLSQIQKADTIVVWGRNIDITNSHILPFIEDKKIVVIDPIKTDIAKKADYHLQIEPRTDYYVAIMLARFIFMEDSQNDEFMEEFAPDFEDFYDYTREHRIKSILSYIGTDLGEMGRVIEYLRDKKVVFLVGTGVQKYSIGSYVLQAIDSLASTLGLFGKEGCGVSYLGNSKLDFINPFEVKTKTVSKVTTPFEQFDTVLIQGANPLESMPDTNSVLSSLESVKDVIYFGLYENETSKRANIVIPAKNFFEKDDVRVSYGHHYVEKMNKIKECEFGISEYDFTKYLFDSFNLETLKDESQYLEEILNQCDKDSDGNYISPAYQELPYSDGFGEDGGDEFVFIDDFDDDFVNTKKFRKYRKESKRKKIDETFWLISIKSKKSLNTQFRRDNIVRVNPSLGYEDNTEIELESEFGKANFIIQNDDSIIESAVVVNSSAYNLNNLTPSIISEFGDSACYGEVKVSINEKGK